jgi:hypothetical protein
MNWMVQARPGIWKPTSREKVGARLEGVARLVEHLHVEHLQDTVVEDAAHEVVHAERGEYITGERGVAFVVGRRAHIPAEDRHEHHEAGLLRLDARLRVAGEHELAGDGHLGAVARALHRRAARGLR